MRRFVAFLFAAGITLVPASAFAVTVEQVVALAKAGVSEAVILALLDRDQTILTIEPDRIVALKREGLSDTLIMAMLRSGRAEGEDAARAAADEKAASILATLPLSAYTPAPDLVVVGHGPDRPNTAYGRGTFYSPSAGYSVRGGYSGYTPPGELTHSPYGSIQARFKRGVGHQGPLRPDRLMCVAQINTPRGPGPSYLTECPAVMQPYGR